MEDMLIRIRSYKSLLLDIAIMGIYIYFLSKSYKKAPEEEVILASSEPPRPLSFPPAMMASMTLPYAPISPATDDLMSIVINMTGVGEVRGYEDKEAADSSLVVDKTPHRLPLVYFSDIDSHTSAMPYQLETIITTYTRNETGSIIMLNVVIATAFINYHRIREDKDPVTFVLSFKKIPTPAMCKKIVFPSLGKFLKVLTMVVCSVMLASVRIIVQEREQKLKEAMKLMGVSTNIYWISWFLTGFIYLFPIVVVISLIFSLDPWQGSSDWAHKSRFIHLVVSAVLNQLLFFCCMVSCFINKASHTVYFIIGIALIPGLISNIVKRNVESRLMNIFFGVFWFPHGYYIGVYSLVIKAQDDGYSFTNLLDVVGKDGEGSASLFDSCLCMSLETLFCMFLIWYLDHIYPGEYGIPQPYNFFLMPSYWKSQEESNEDANIELPPQDELYFEPDPEGLEVGVQVQNLVKVFGKYIAVAGTSMNMYKNQITVLLGHNGAGKTTTLSMISGFLPPSKGTAIINGYDVRTQTFQARKCIGLCPQHDILFDELTCTEHLRFYLWLRGETEDMTSHCQDLLTQVGLEFKMNTKASQLSGGQKRKLSVATAVIGSKVVILDEPSSGMDPSARREMWVFLSSIRQDRTLLLTTHYMDEAEYLGDRIAIMADGVIKCCGTPLFLKDLYGAGYLMNVVMLPDCKPENVTRFLRFILPGIEFMDSSRNELQYNLPEDNLKAFPDLFLQLEENLEELGISSFGLNATTMEDVFLKVGEGFEPKPKCLWLEDEIKTDVEEEESQEGEEGRASQGNFNESSNKNESSNVKSSNEKSTQLLDFNEGYELNTGAKRKRQQMKAMLIKRLLLMKRSWVSTICLFVVLPTGALTLGLYTDLKLDKAVKERLKSFQFKPFEKNSSVYFWAHSGVDKNFVSIYTDLFSGTKNKAKQITDEKNITQYYFNVGETMDMKDYNNTFLTGGEFFAVNDTFVRATALYNFGGSEKYEHIVSVKILLEALIKYYVGKEDSEYSAEFTQKTSFAKLFKDKKFMIFTTIMMSLVMAILPTIFIRQLILEKQRGSKHLQRISGIDPISFWIPNFFFDLYIYMVTVVCIVVATAIGYSELFIYFGQGWFFIVALVLHGMAILACAYFLQMVFRNPSQGLTVTAAVNIVAAFIAIIGWSMDFGARQKGVDQGGSSFFYIVLTLLSPIFNLATLLMYAQEMHLFSKTVEPKEVFEKEEIQEALIKMAVQFVGYFILVFIADFKLLRNIRYKCLPPADIERLKATSKVEKNEAVDNDVMAEVKKVQVTPIDRLTQENSLVMKAVFKVYGNMLAVDNAHLGLKKNECFGLLGQNGAGKTTIFKMLTGDVAISRGDIYFLRQDAKTSLGSILEHIGYCPQYDALDDDMTGRETLYLYGRLRGVPEAYLDHVAKQLMEHLTITPHADKLTCHYSGGNKRKLSVGLSLIGNPDFIFLDEPTAGIDPAARRALWDLFKNIRSAGKTIIMTSHSMEECEALCTRLAIMVTGSFRCIGSLQHLKNKFAQGLAIFAKMHSAAKTEKERQSFLNFLTKSFKGNGVKITENKPEYVHFIISGKNVKWSKVFETMEASREKFNVAKYSCQQTSLEEIFLMFVRGANPPTRGRLPCQQQCMNLICE